VVQAPLARKSEIPDLPEPFYASEHAACGGGAKDVEVFCVRRAANELLVVHLTWTAGMPWARTCEHHVRVAVAARAINSMDGIPHPLKSQRLR
jgi:hypothetical protein